MKTKICTSVEQSKKLIKLGLDPNTADVNRIRLGTNDAAAWQCELNLGERNHHNTTQYNNSLDAAFEMVCWLKENNEL